MKTPEELSALKEKDEPPKEILAEPTEEELKQAAGGTANQSEVWYCKYCSEWTFQTWIGVGPGWDRDGNKHWCDLWQCEKCTCTNYRDVNTGSLL